MKIFELIDILNRSDILLNESMSLSELRRRIIKNEMRLDPSEEDWYQEENNRNELIGTLSRIVGPTCDPMLNRELKKFNTNKYTERGRIVKPKSLNNALELEILRAENRITDENDNLSSQYEKLNIKKDVEIYSVFTPQANIQLSHKILKNNQEATWCIASPTDASRMWSHYELWNAEYPCVFIVVKRGIVNGIRNPKYEIKCNPKRSSLFANNIYHIFDFIDEVRDAKQDESNLDDTSLFKVTGIDEQTLENAMRKLMNTDKAYSFSKKYGIGFTNKINALKDDKKLSSNERRQLLIMACKTGMIHEYWDYINIEDTDFFIDRLIEYKTLSSTILVKYIDDFESEIIDLDIKMVQKMINFFIKNKKCDLLLLRVCKGLEFSWADDLYNKVFYSIKTYEPKMLRMIPIDMAEKYIKRNHLLACLNAQEMIDPHDIIHLIKIGYIRNYNEFYDTLKIYLKKKGSVAYMIDHLKYSEYTSYIEYAIIIAHQINELYETDIDYLYANRNIPEIENAIESLQLKKPDGRTLSQRIIHMIEEDIKNVLPKIDSFGKSIKFLGSLLYATIKDDKIILDELPDLIDIVRSDENNNDINSRLKSYMTSSYKYNEFDLDELYADCVALDDLANLNQVSRKLGSNAYYDNPIPDYPMSPYQFYRLTLYKKLYEMN